MRVDFYRHDLQAEDAASVAAVIGSPFLTTGRVCNEVEAQIAAYFDLSNAVLVNSWTNGAFAVLLAMGIGPGDEVIVPAMTFIASANVIELTGAKAVFADVDPATLLMTPELVSPHVTECTRAVMPVHLYGQMVDIPAMRKMLSSHPKRSKTIRIIEDCAHCFEGRRDGLQPGAVSDCAIFSFYATKNITCGEGGAIISRDGELDAAVRETRQHGMSALAVDRFAGGKYNHWDMHRLGTKANLPDLLAALLPRQVATIDERLPIRQDIAQRYRTAFANGPLRLVEQTQSGQSAEHLFPIGIPSGKRDDAIAALNAGGIGVTVNYRAVTEMEYYKTRYPYAVDNCPVAQCWGSQTLTLPLFPGLSRAEQDYVIETVKSKVYPLLDTAQR